MTWVIITILALTLGGSFGYIIALRAKLDFWVSPEQFDITRAMLRREAEQNLQNWKNCELHNIRENERVWAINNAKTKLVEWTLENEARIRADAIKRSEGITKGKITEHLIPFFPEFGYNPKDARFLGSPVDLIVFDGMSEAEPTKIVFVEVKTGTSGLTTRERQIRDLVTQGKVEWKTINPQEK